MGRGVSPAGAKPPRAAPSSTACPTTRSPRRRPHPAPVSRVVWGSCAQTPRHLRSPLRARAAKSGSRVGERGRAPHRARPPTRPPQRHRRGPGRHRRLGVRGVVARCATPRLARVRIGHAAPPTPEPATTTVPRCKGCRCGPRSHAKPRLPDRPRRTTDAVPGHRHRPTLQGVSSRSAQSQQAAPAGPPTPHHRRRPRSPPPSHVARGVVAVRTDTPGRACRPAHPAPPTPSPVTTTVPRCKGCRRAPRSHARPRLPARPPRTTDAVPGHRHRPTLQGVSSRSAQTRQAAPPGPAAPHHRRRLRRPPPSRFVWGSCAILPAAPSPNAG